MEGAPATCRMDSLRYRDFESGGFARWRCGAHLVGFVFMRLRKNRSYFIFWRTRPPEMVISSQRVMTMWWPERICFATIDARRPSMWALASTTTVLTILVDGKRIVGVARGFCDGGVRQCGLFARELRFDSISASASEYYSLTKERNDARHKIAHRGLSSFSLSSHGRFNPWAHPQVQLGRHGDAIKKPSRTVASNDRSGAADEGGSGGSLHRSRQRGRSIVNRGRIRGAHDATVGHSYARSMVFNGFSPSIRDQRLIKDLVSGTTRWRRRLDCIISHLANRSATDLDPAVLQVGHMF